LVYHRKATPTKGGGGVKGTPSSKRGQGLQDLPMWDPTRVIEGDTPIRLPTDNIRTIEKEGQQTGGKKSPTPSAEKNAERRGRDPHSSLMAPLMWENTDCKKKKLETVSEH